MKALLAIMITTCYIQAQHNSPNLLSDDIRRKFTNSDGRKASLSSENLLKTHRTKKDYSEQEHEPTPPASKEPTPEDPETAQQSPNLKSLSSKIIIESIESPVSPRRQSSPNIKVPSSPLKKSPEIFSKIPQFIQSKKTGATPLPTTSKQSK